MNAKRLPRGHRDIFAKDIEWRPGSGPGIVYSRFVLDEEMKTSPSVIMSRFEPGAAVPAHTHGCNYFEYIIEGSQTVGKVTFGAGDVRVVQEGVGYGPIKVGPDGCTVLVVFQDGSRAATESLPRRPSTQSAAA